MEQPDSLSSLLAIFDTEEKAKLVEHCKGIVIRRSDFLDLILACQADGFPISHLPVFQQFHPPQANLTAKDLNAIAENGVGPFTPRAKKAARKIMTMFNQRRLFAGHMFWFPAHAGKWHLFYFDQRDTTERDNHWEYGSHIHLMNMTTHPQVDPNELLNGISNCQSPKLGGSIHIRYQR